MNGGGSWSKWTHPLLQSLWPTTNSTPLPSWEDAQTLVNDFFENYNTVLPIFHPPTFMALLGRQYARSSNVVEDPAWSAALNAVLAMAQRRRAEQAPQTRELADCAWAYARNALELILAVHMRSVSLLSVQATVALAWFFRGTPNPQPLFFLTAAAVRLSHSAGLHRGADHLPLSQTDREQRLRVFWIALILDSSASLRTGRPCTHSINDIGVRLPSGSPKDNLGIIVNRQGTAVLNFLLVKAQFSVLEAKIYDRIFASDSSKKSTEALAADVRDLGQELDEWSRVVPGGTNTDNIADNWDHQHPHIVSLLLAYHSCVITVHSATWQRHFTSVRGRRFSRQDFDVSSRGFPHAAKCLHAAHEIVKFLSFVPQESTSFIWEMIHRPVQASMLFFICLLQQPDNSDAESHLRAMDVAIAFISKLMGNQEESFIQPVLVVSQELTRIARAAVQRGRARTDRSQLDRAALGQAADTNQSLRTQHQPPFQANPTPGLSSPAPTIPPMPEEDFIPSQANPTEAARPTQGFGPTSAEHLASDVGFQELSNVDQGIIGIDQLSGLSLPFSWNWQDLSTGLLEDFNLL